MDSDRPQYRGAKSQRQSNSSSGPLVPGSRLAVGTILVLTAVACFFSACGGPSRVSDETALAPRPSLYETSLPHPLNYLSFDQYQRPPDMRPNLRIIRPLLHLDADGRLIDITCENAEDSGQVAIHRYAFDALRFEPGRRGLEKTAMVLPVTMLVGDTAGPPRVTFPVDRTRRVADGALYFEALALNGVMGPQLERFPSYYFKTPRVVSHRYPFKLYGFDINTAGKAANVVFVRGDSDTFNDQLASAIRWAKFSPASVDGRVRVAHAFLVVSLFPQVHYPTDEWTDVMPDSLPLTDRVRLRLVADTVGLLQTPVPLKDWSGEITRKSYHGVVEGTISARLRIDTLGAGTTRDFSCENWKPIAVLGQKAFLNRFFPARDWAGQVVPFEGLVYMEYEDESNVRIRFGWHR